MRRILIAAHMLSTLLIAGLTGISIGGLAAAQADRYPSYRTTLRNLGGSLICGGVALLGIALPMI
jgi:hypothetical protein